MEARTEQCEKRNETKRKQIKAHEEKITSENPKEMAAKVETDKAKAERKGGQVLKLMSGQGKHTSIYLFTIYYICSTIYYLYNNKNRQCKNKSIKHTYMYNTS